MLAEVINEDQFAFLPKYFIFNNILAQHKLIQWAQDNKLDMVLLKLEF
jgi:hypothetical protein